MESYDHSREIEAQSLIRSALSEASNSENPPIFRVPTATRQNKPKSFSPRTVSLGPYHHTRLRGNEHKKREYSEAFIIRTRMSLDDVRREIQRNVEEIRNCYECDIEPNDDKLVAMMVLDGSFVIEFLIKIFLGDKSAQDNEADFRDDFLILENQVPMVVLKQLFGLAHETSGTSLLEIILHFFKIFNTGHIEENVNGKHFVDLVRYCLLPRSIRVGCEQERAEKEVLDKVCCASDLFDDGVIFKLSESQSLLDITFQDRTLTMSRLVINNSTLANFRNILAYEKHYCSKSTFVTAFFQMLKFLVDSEKDLKILTDSHIIVCMDRDKGQAIDIIKRLGTDFHLNGPYPQLFSVCEELNNFHADPDNRTKAEIQRRYFGTPCKTVTTIALAFGILVLLILYSLGKKKM